MIWKGWGSGKSWGKNLTATCVGKNFINWLARTKTQHEFSARAPPPKSLMVRP